MATFFNFPPAANPIHWPSGEKYSGWILPATFVSSMNLAAIWGAGHLLVTVSFQLSGSPFWCLSHTENKRVVGFRNAEGAIALKPESDLFRCPGRLSRGAPMLSACDRRDQ